MRVTGWAMWRDDKPCSFDLDKSKEGLLIGYDMVSLRGLSACEQYLATRGMVPYPTMVETVEEGEG